MQMCVLHFVEARTNLHNCFVTFIKADCLPAVCKLRLVLFDIPVVLSESLMDL